MMNFLVVSRIRSPFSGVITFCPEHLRMYEPSDSGFFRIAVRKITKSLQNEVDDGLRNGRNISRRVVFVAIVVFQCQ